MNLETRLLAAVGVAIHDPKARVLVASARHVRAIELFNDVRQALVDVPGMQAHRTALTIRLGNGAEFHFRALPFPRDVERVRGVRYSAFVNDDAQPIEERMVDTLRVMSRIPLSLPA